jgi:hypothetical protein
MQLEDPLLCPSLSTARALVQAAVDIAAAAAGAAAAAAVDCQVILSA